MRALDSNVFLRYLVGDHPHQASVAEKIFEESGKGEESLFVPVLGVTFNKVLKGAPGFIIL